MKYYNDTWEVIDNYFSTTPYFLTKHHLDSYNDFVSNKILATIKVLNNAFVVLKNENNGATQNEINVYIGGLEGNEVFINKPTIVEDGEARLLYPNEARLRDMTYQSELFANIHIVIRSSTIGQPEKIIEKVFKNVKIGAIPIMLHSKLCVLHDQHSDVLREMGECPYDQGGYFVVDGKEKVIVAQERIATNRVFITQSKDIKYSYEGLIRCTSIENPLFPKTTYLYVNDVRPNSEMVDNAVYIAIPNVMKPIPIFILFRALGIESDKQIMEYIMYDVNDPINTKMLEFLRYSVIDSHDVYSQEEALAYIAKYVEYNSLDRLKYTLVNDLFPNVGHNFKNKALFLGHIVSKIVRVALGASQETDRDNFQYKRVDISGFLLANLFRDYYNQFRNVVRNNIDRAYLYGPWKTSGLENLINKGNMNTIFQPHIIEDGMRKSLKGSWGKLMIKEDFKAEDLENIKQEIVQDLNRFSYAGTISHLRRCNTPLDPTAVKMVGPHKLHTTQWGIMCPAESPDGGSIGLLKNFAILANVTFDVPVETLIKGLEILGMKYIEDVQTSDVAIMTKISVNSNWIGVCNNPLQMYRTLKLMKRNALINIYTSISWDIFNREINILTESGRCCRPLYIVGQNNTLIIDKHFDRIKKKQVNWVDLIKGDLIPTEKFSHTFDGFIDPLKMYETKNGKKAKDLEDVIEFLEKTQAPIEYTDVEETNGHLIAMDGDVLTKDKKQYTHCEIHASTMLSAIGVNTPYSDHNQAPRNIFSTGQCKQSIGMYATNFNNRIDTMTYIMNYPHRPITATRYGEYTNFNTMTHGQNLIVAVATYTGYNQEDSIIFNKTSVERGMFNLTYYKNMVDAEEENKKNNEAMRFANPLRLLEEGKNLTELKFANYKKLDDNGFPKVGSYIHEGDAIIGKCKIKTEFIEDEATKNNIFNNKIKREVYEDKSVVADKTVSGIIDRVFVYFDDHNNKKVKIRFRKNRDSQIGDKNCCYDKMTEVLTDKGWLHWDQLTYDHKVATLRDGKFIEYTKPLNIFEYDYDGKMYSVETNNVSLCVTPNHKLFVSKNKKDYSLIKAEDTVGKKLWHTKIADNDNMDVPSIKIGETDYDMDAFLAFFGVWLAEGWWSVTKNKNHEDHYVSLAVNKERVRESLDASVTKMNLHICKDKNNEKWRIYNRQLSEFLQRLYPKNNAIHKYLPDFVWSLSQRQCKILLDAMICGDGTITPTNQPKYFTSSKMLADDVQKLALHSGCCANLAVNREAGSQAYFAHEDRTITTKNTSYEVRIITKRVKPEIRYNKLVNWIDYQGKVYCCETPYGMVYVRRNGKTLWCGNSRAGQLIG
jgi:DNA-directed RNA polymerase II subunit RPB2